MGFKLNVLSESECVCGDYHFELILNGINVGTGRCGIIDDDRFILKLSKSVSDALENYNVVVVGEIIHSALSQYVTLTGKDYRSLGRMFDILTIDATTFALSLDVSIYNRQSYTGDVNGH